MQKKRGGCVRTYTRPERGKEKGRDREGEAGRQGERIEVFEQRNRRPTQGCCVQPLGNQKTKQELQHKLRNPN